MNKRKLFYGAAATVIIFIGEGKAQDETSKLEKVTPTISGRTSRGLPVGGLSKPRMGDPVLPVFPTPPVPIKDLAGYNLAWISDGFECSANWKQYCEDKFTVAIPKGWEYCSHNFHISEGNNIKFQVRTSKDHVTVWYQVLSGDFFDRYGGNIDADLVVGVVMTGNYSSDKCLPVRNWGVYAHGKSMGDGLYDDRCASMPAYEVPFDKHCATLEHNPVSAKSLSSAPCITCGKDPDKFPSNPGQ